MIMHGMIKKETNTMGKTSSLRISELGEMVKSASIFGIDVNTMFIDKANQQTA
jgi:hypothetical protein